MGQNHAWRYTGGSLVMPYMRTIDSKIHRHLITIPVLFINHPICPIASGDNYNKTPHALSLGEQPTPAHSNGVNDLLSI